ncbi:hypothetical protein Sru01_38790 [Sphaerisporangium rufum]|uniref:Uncharacterized protein n=1 Tax=Sphaerisporangium rufum TaxID=1381558 RepID=A0A919V1R4_9ACTN|nr:MarR family winged helix-turn-helix transcriptional regulator [Sphaerisporangium rufum]GII78897.1 hypothetical protein Sru01_38790 [Sphaerisporangium rufum]
MNPAGPTRDPAAAAHAAGREPAGGDVEVLEAVQREAGALFGQATRLVEALAARAGLRPAQFRCLCALYRYGSLPLPRLARLAGLTEQAAARTAEDLRTAGHPLVATHDGRRTVITVDRAVHRSRIEPALRELREAWHPLIRAGCDDLLLVAGLVGGSRRLTILVNG